MSPPNPTVAFSLWTDKMIILSLEDYNQGKPLPCSLLSDLNPYSYLPSNLPDGIGYLLSSDVKKDTQFGSWKANGEPSEIFINSVLTGWRTTFEFFEGRFPNEKKTEWVMQEYRITPKGQGDGSKAKDYGSLCRILQNKECIPDQGINMILLPRSNSTGGRGSKSEAQNIGDVEGVSLTSAERRDCALRGDFLELADLPDPQSPSSWIGYLLSSDVKKDTQFGSWKANGEPSEVFINSVLTGWRTTFEFFEGQFPNEKKTDWVMQEYIITPKGQGDGSKAKDYGSLCRILQNKECIPDQGINMILLPRSNSTGGRGSKSEAQNIGDVEGVSLTSAERRDCALRGDFLELADLPDPQSPSSWIGYLLSSDVKKDTQFGSWKANGEPSEVFINSVLTGWRTTFEFFEGQFPNEKKTDWVMQEYIITPKGQGDGSKAKDYGSLCRILQNKECIPDQGINMIPLPRSNSTGGRGSKSEAQNIGDVEGVSLTSAERRDCALRDDFLELADLADPQSPFSTSFNSSCPTLASEEWFDSDMLLQEMEDKKIDQKEQFKYTVSGTVKPNGVVMRPAIVGKLTAEEPMKSNCSLPALVVRGEKDGLVRECKQEIEAVYTSEKASASSGHDRALNEKQKEKKGVPRQIKKLQKFFCL